MGSINKSHNEADGGILLFNGELILLYCDSVQCDVGGKESFKGRVYLTTHRLVIIMTPYRQNASVKSFCAPFCAITKCSVEQPVFGANYIEATVRDEADPTKSFTFKLKFSKGGAIELAMAMNRAVQAVGRNFNPSMPPPPAYTPSPTAQYYQAPPNVYAPGYNTGIPMPVQQFPDQPPIGFIYASESPPPYPGIGGNQGPYQQQQQPQGYPPNTSGGYPGQQQQQPGQQPYGGYPGQQQSGGYPGQQQPQSGGYPGQQQPQSGGYPGQQPPQSGGYPGQQQQAGGYPGQQPSGYPGQQPQAGQQWGGYPGQQAPAYPQQPSASGYPQQPPTSQPSAYPNLNQMSAPQQNQAPGQSDSQGSWPSAPSFNPNWTEDKKNV